MNTLRLTSGIKPRREMGEMLASHLNTPEFEKVISPLVIQHYQQELWGRRNSEPAFCSWHYEQTGEKVPTTPQLYSIRILARMHTVRFLTVYDPYNLLLTDETEEDVCRHLDNVWIDYIAAGGESRINKLNITDYDKEKLLARTA